MLAKPCWWGPARPKQLPMAATWPGEMVVRMRDLLATPGWCLCHLAFFLSYINNVFVDSPSWGPCTHTELAEFCIQLFGQYIFKCIQLSFSLLPFHKAKVSGCACFLPKISNYAAASKWFCVQTHRKQCWFSKYDYPRHVHVCEVSHEIARETRHWYKSRVSHKLEAFHEAKNSHLRKKKITNKTGLQSLDKQFDQEFYFLSLSCTFP